MARIELSRHVLDDFARFRDHMAHFEVIDAPIRLGRILDAIQLLSHSPLIGRPAHSGNRELLIGQGAQGYVALYRYLARADLVVVLAIRNQRESGYKRVPPA